MRFDVKKLFFVLFALAALIFAGLALMPKTVPEQVAAADIDPTPTPVLRSGRVVKTDDAITIAAVGDLMIGSTSINDTFLPPNDGADMLREFTPILSAADIAFGNLEGPMLEGGTTSKCPPTSKRCFAFRMPTRYAKHFKDAGFDVLSMANNHAGDFGDFGRISTRQTLDAAGIKHAGSEKGSFASTIVTVKGRRVAFVAFAHNRIVPNLNDLAETRQLVEAASRNADIVVVSFHGGAEGPTAQRVPNRTETYGGELRGNLPLFARTVIDAGADLVLGHGPHILRGMEIYKDRLVVYSMGNFATYGMFRIEAETALTAVFETKLASDGRFLSGRLHSGKQIGRGIPQLDPTGEAIRKVRDLSQLDFGVNAPKIADDGTFVK